MEKFYTFLVIFLIFLTISNMLNAAEASASELAKLETQRKTTPLIEAIIENKEDVLAKIGQLIKAGADINEQDAHGDTALHWAIKQMEKENAAEVEEAISLVVKLLLSQSTIDVNIPDENGLTPLMLAILANKPELVGKLISLGAKVEGFRGSRGRVHVINGVLEFLRQKMVKSSLTREDAEKAVLVQQTGFTPLMFALQVGNPEVVKLLCEAGAAPGAVTYDFSPEMGITNLRHIRDFIKDPQGEVAKLIKRRINQIRFPNLPGLWDQPVKI